MTEQDLVHARVVMNRAAQAELAATKKWNAMMENLVTEDDENAADAFYTAEVETARAAYSRATAEMARIRKIVEGR